MSTATTSQTLPRGWAYPRVVAHRGGGIIAPENTLAGMRAAQDHGHRAVEFDVMLAADGVPVLMHDDTLGRTVAGRGSIAGYTSQQLTAMDAGAWQGPHFRGEPVPLFVDVAQWLWAQGIWMNIEIKPVPGFEAETGKVVGAMTQALFGQAPSALRPVLSSFSIEALAAAQGAAPDMPRGLLMSRVPRDWKDQLESLACVSVHCNHRNLDARLASAIKAEGYGLMCYTVNDTARAREILGWGVDAFCTDRIDLIGADFR